MRVLITGAGGFVGKYLVKALSDRGYHVICGGFPNDKISLLKDVEVFQINVSDYDSVQKVFVKSRPEAVIHLAAQSMVKKAWEEPDFTVLVNTIGTINLIKAVTSYAPYAKLINIGTSEEYGLTGKIGKPLKESDECLPQNPYAVSKLAAGQIALQIARKENLNIVHVRPFNHFGPGQGLGYVVSDFSSQIVQIEKGLIDNVIKVGDLSPQRDFTDVHDVIDAYIGLLETKVENGIYNICSGTPQSIQYILDFLIKKSQADIEVQTDKERLRPADVPLFIGSAAKINQTVGWFPKRTFENSLLETLEWWRKKI